MVEVPPVTASWQKSRLSGDPTNECVEIFCTHEHVRVRDSKNPCGPVLGFTREGWATFVTGVRCDEFNRPRGPA
ncbi:MAG: DUF397 domain-containing protein [Pseudonocardiales bacterium]